MLILLQYHHYCIKFEKLTKETKLDYFLDNRNRDQSSQQKLKLKKILLLSLFSNT